MAAVAEHALTVLISSHVVTELERVCDWMIVLAGGGRSGRPGRSTTWSRGTGC